MRGSRAPIQRDWKPPPLVPVIAIRRGVHVVAGEQVVDGSHPVPHHVAHEAGAGDRREVAEDGVLAADEVVAAAPSRRVPELAALALADGVPAKDDVATAHESCRDLLIAGVRLADRRVTAGDEDRRLLPDGSLRHVDEGGHVEAGQALEDELVDPVAVHRDRAGDARVERRLRVRQPADDVEGLPPQLRLQGDEVGLGSHTREALLARHVEGPGALELVDEVRRDARALGLGLEDLQHPGRGDFRAESRRREDGTTSPVIPRSFIRRATRDPQRSVDARWDRRARNGQRAQLP